MKDSWQDVAVDGIMEGKVYQILNGDDVRNIPKCLEFCDFNGDYYHQTRAELFVHRSWVPQEFRPSITTRQHHRFILDTVGKRLEQFSFSHEMVCVVRAALVGMNLESYVFIC